MVDGIVIIYHNCNFLHQCWLFHVLCFKHQLLSSTWNKPLARLNKLATCVNDIIISTSSSVNTAGGYNTSCLKEFFNIGFLVNNIFIRPKNKSSIP